MPKPRARRDAIVMLTPLEDTTVRRDRRFAGPAPRTRPRRLSLGFREMARDMGHQRRGRPNLEIIPASE